MFNWIYHLLNKNLFKTKHETIKLEWKKAALESLLKNKENMTPEEFMREYQRLV